MSYSGAEGAGPGPRGGGAVKNLLRPIKSDNSAGFGRNNNGDLLNLVYLLVPGSRGHED